MDSFALDFTILFDRFDRFYVAHILLMVSIILRSRPKSFDRFKLTKENKLVQIDVVLIIWKKVERETLISFY